MGDFSWLYNDLATLTGDKSYLKKKPVTPPTPSSPTALTQPEIENVLRGAGWDERHVPKMAAIAMGESARDKQGRALVNSFNPGVGPGGVPTKEKSAGLFQVNLLAHPQYDKQKLMSDPTYAAKAALDIFNERKSKGQDPFGPWGAYTNGSYRQFYKGRALSQPQQGASGNDYSFVQNDLKNILGDAISPHPDYSFVQDDLKKLGLGDIPTGTRPAPTNPTQTIPRSSTANIALETPDALLQRLDQPLEAPNVGLTGPGVTTPLPIQKKGRTQVVQPTTAQLPQIHTTEPTISEQNYDEKTGQPIDAQGNIIPQTNLQGVQVGRNDVGEAGEPIDIPENIKTANEANAYVRQYLQAKYPDGDFSKGQFLKGYTPGQGAFVDFATLKRAGVDTDALISQKIAENRGSTEAVPDLSIKANLPEMDAQGIKDFLGGHPYLFGAWSSGKGRDALSQAIGSALNAGGNTANALAGAIRVIGQLNPARMDSMAEAAGLKPYRAGEDIVKYLKEIANTTSQFAEASGGKYQDVAGASDKGSLEGRPIQRKTLASEVGSAIGGLADVPRLSLYPGGPIVAFAADNALQTAAQGDEADWSNVLKAAGKGGALGAATLVAPGVGKLAEKAGAGTLLAKGLELGSVAPAVGLTSLALGDSPSEAFKNAVLFTGFHLYGMAKDRIVNTPIRVADERGNEAVIEVNKNGDVRTLDPKTDAQVQVRIPEQTYTEAEKTPIAKPTEPLPTAEKPVTAPKTAAEAKALPPELVPFAKNKILTVDKVAAARERLKGKETQFNTGLDPETLKDLAIIGGAHIEAGVRSAAELAKVMAKDFGEGIKKHIDEIYAQIHKDYGDKFTGMEPPVTEAKPIIGKGVVEPPTETVKPTEPERGTSKIGKSIEQKAIDDGLTEGFPETAGYDKKHVEDQKARIGKLIENDYDAARRMVTGTQRIPPEISPVMLIRGMEEVAKARRNDPELRYELANSPIASESSIHAQEMRMMQEREPDSANAALQALRKERSNQVQKVLRGRTVEQAIKEEAEKLAQTLRPTMERAKRALKTKETWNSFIDSITC